MFEVTRYDHPHIFVTCHRTGETYRFSIGSDDALRGTLSFSWSATAKRRHPYKLIN